MNLTSPLDYVIAVSGILTIFVSFAWNIYEVFLHKSNDSSDEDSAIR